MGTGITDKNKIIILEEDRKRYRQSALKKKRQIQVTKEVTKAESKTLGYKKQDWAGAGWVPHQKYITSYLFFVYLCLCAIRPFNSTDAGNVLKQSQLGETQTYF